MLSFYISTLIAVMLPLKFELIAVTGILIMRWLCFVDIRKLKFDKCNTII